MKIKRELGMGLRKKALRKKKKSVSTPSAATRNLPISKRGGFLRLLPTLSALAMLTSEATGVARTVNDLRNKQKTGQGFYLANYEKTEAGIKRNKRRKHRTK